MQILINATKYIILYYIVMIKKHHLPLIIKKTERNIFYQIVPVTLINGKLKENTYAFFDTGSSLTLIEQETANKLNLRGKLEPLTMSWTKNIQKKQHPSDFDGAH